MTPPLHIVVCEPDASAAEECPDCGFDALLTFPLKALGGDGVGDAGTHRACVRCFEEREPGR